MGLSVITYTGKVWEDLRENPDWRRLLEATDILVDGPFVRNLRDLDLRFRGSSNQRPINVRRSLAAGKPVLVSDNFVKEIRPEAGGFSISIPPVPGGSGPPRSSGW
jgi:anaerobic ribonucleoside-triphosphate reductase activating protein